MHMAIWLTTDAEEFRVLTRRRFGALSAATLATAVTAGCSTDRPGSRSADRVTYLTGFGIAGREAHAWVAKAKGFFGEAGLEVAIRPGAAGDANHQVLTSGQAQFAAVDASGAFIRFGRGADRTFQIVGAIQQTTLLSIVTLDDRKISAPRDLEGKRIGVAAGAAPRTLFPAYAKLAKLDESRVTWVEVPPPQLTSILLAGRVAAIARFIVGAAGVEKAAKRKTVVLPYSQYISDLFGTVLVTPTKVADGNPDLVRRFTGALMRGLQYTIEHPDEAGRILHEAEPTQDPALAAKEIALMQPYVRPSTGAQIGALDRARVARTIAVLQSLSLIPAGLTADQLVRTDLLGNAPRA
jgi:NitT/TauT family transport system substrate-binding protein